MSTSSSCRNVFVPKDGGLDPEPEIFDDTIRFLRNARDVARMVDVDIIYT